MSRFMSPDYRKFVKVLNKYYWHYHQQAQKMLSTTETQEDKIQQEYRTVEVMLSCFQMEANAANRLSKEYDALL